MKRMFRFITLITVLIWMHNCHPAGRLLQEPQRTGLHALVPPALRALSNNEKVRHVVQGVAIAGGALAAVLAVRKWLSSRIAPPTRPGIGGAAATNPAANVDEGEVPIYREGPLPSDLGGAVQEIRGGGNPQNAGGGSGGSQTSLVVERVIPGVGRFEMRLSMINNAGAGAGAAPITHPAGLPAHMVPQYDRLFTTASRDSSARLVCRDGGCDSPACPENVRAALTARGETVTEDLVFQECFRRAMQDVAEPADAAPRRSQYAAAGAGAGGNIPPVASERELDQYAQEYVNGYKNASGMLECGAGDAHCDSRVCPGTVRRELSARGAAPTEDAVFQECCKRVKDRVRSLEVLVRRLVQPADAAPRSSQHAAAGAGAGVEGRASSLDEFVKSTVNGFRDSSGQLHCYTSPGEPCRENYCPDKVRQELTVAGTAPSEDAVYEECCKRMKIALS